MPLWRETHEVYRRIRVPVLLVYGDRDWSREAERQQTLREIPGARLVMVENGGHFLPLDRPDAVIKQISGFAQELSTQLSPKATKDHFATFRARSAQDDR
jgi:pimeloyl-ACP methyl ester carboxylesterase